MDNFYPVDNSVDNLYFWVSTSFPLLPTILIGFLMIQCNTIMYCLLHTSFVCFFSYNYTLSSVFPLHTTCILRPFYTLSYMVFSLVC